MKKLFNSSLLLIFLLSIISCQYKESKSLNLINTVELNFNLFVRLINCGTITIEDETFYYLTDVSSRKKICVYNHTGEELFQISLAECAKAIGEIDAISLHNFDTIYCFNDKHGFIVQINRNGEILNKKNLSSFLNNQYEFFVNQNGIFHLKDELVFGIKPTLINLDSKYFDNYWNYILTANSIRYQSPYLVKFQNPFISNLTQHNYLLKGYYKRFLNNDQDISEGSNFEINEKEIIVWSWYNDTITFLDLVDSTQRLVKIKSKYSSLAVPTMDSITNKSGPSHLLRKYGAITRIKYDPYRELYYILMLHNTPGNEDGMKYRDFSIAVYDKDFVKLTEEKFCMDKHLGHIMVNKEGLVMVRYNPDNYLPGNYDKQYFFEIYRYE
jgi:hypothetical protein